MQLKIDIEQGKRAKLKTLSECKLLKTYNRRDNIEILGLEQNLAHGQRETYQTAEIVQKVAQEKNDISIAHRLPSNNGTPKPVIARFTRRVT